MSKRKLSGQLRTLLRRLVRERDGDRCCWCHEPMLFNELEPGKDNPNRATLEHVIPLALGGSRRALKNLALAHWHCNVTRGHALNRQLAGGSADVRSDPVRQPLDVAADQRRRARDRLYTLDLSVRRNRS